MEGTMLDDCKYGVVQQVTIVEVGDKTVTFSTRSASKTGDPNECLLRSFTVPLAEVYTTPIPDAPAPVPLKPGATGPLFLSRDAWSTTRSDGYLIYGLDQVTFKWPDCAAAPARVLSSLTVIPTSIVVRGHLAGATELFELELLGPDAAQVQDICWRGAEFIRLALTPSGAARLGAGACATIVAAWPTQIAIQGSPEVAPALSGEVDILNTELAGDVQQFSFLRHGQPIALSLTQDGVGAFHVTPQIVDELMRARGRTPSETSALR